MSAKKEVKIGTKVSNFRLKDQNGQLFRLADWKGKRILLSFHPLAWTSVCSQQMKSVEKNQKILDKLNTIGVGISVDSIPCKSAWAKALKISQTRLLADFWPHGGFAELFGILRKEGFSERANIIVNEKGAISFKKIYPIGELPDMAEIIEILKS